MHYLKSRQEKWIFTSRAIYDWWLEGILVFAQILVLLLVNCGDLFWLMPGLFSKWLRSFEEAKHYFNTETHDAAGTLCLDSSFLG